jgi:hypothetical protein
LIGFQARTAENRFEMMRESAAAERSGSAFCTGQLAEDEEI